MLTEMTDAELIRFVSLDVERAARIEESRRTPPIADRNCIGGFDMGMGWLRRICGWQPYVSVAERRRKAMKKMDALRKKGVDIQPVTIEGRKIAKSFWGEAWCEHLESFSDFENRLPRGRTYVRNGSVCHLAVAKGQIEAKVSGSELYTVKVEIKTLPGKKWTAIKGRCSGQIGSLLELLQGRLSDHVMEVVTDRKEGLFPSPARCRSSAVAPTGPGCASTSPPCCTASGRGWTRSRSCCSCSAA